MKMTMRDFKDKLNGLGKHLTKAQPKAPDDLATDESLKDKDSPYVKGRQAWDELYGSTVTQLENSYRLNALQLIVNIALAWGLIHVATQSKLVPYIVQVDSASGVITGVASKTLESNGISDQLIQNQLQHFILAARSVTGDPDVNQNNIYAAQALTKGNASALLANYYKQNNPLSIGKTNKITVKVLYEIKQTNNSYQIAWQETTTTLDDQVIEQKNYVAQVAYKLGDVSNVRYNPVGIYITDISWTQQI